MKTKMISMFFAASLILSLSGEIRANNMLKFVAQGNQVLEMPVYQEQEILEVIPGSTTNTCCMSDDKTRVKEDLLNPATMSKILICINKPELEEPFPYYVN